MLRGTDRAEAAGTGAGAPRVSVAMTTFNGARFLREQIATLEAQTLRPHEVIVADDGSSDDTVAILEEAAARGAIRIEVRRNPERLGWRRNFFDVMSRCSGDLVQFCDQDDLWEPTKLEEMAAATSAPGVVMAYHDATMVDVDGHPIGALGRGADGGVVVHEPLSLDFWTPILGFSIMFRREVLDHGHLWPSSMDKLKPGEPAAHDEWVFFLASTLGRVAHVTRPLVRYRIHETNTMGFRHTRRTLSDVVEAYRGSGEKLRQRIAVTRNRVSILEALAAGGGASAPAFAAGAAAYAAHLALNERRLAMYGRRALPSRGVGLARMLVGGAYATRSLPLSRGERARDLAVAVFGLREA